MKTRYLKVGNVRRRLSVSDGKIPTVGISLKAQTERINGLLGFLSSWPLFTLTHHMLVWIAAVWHDEALRLCHSWRR